LLLPCRCVAGLEHGVLTPDAPLHQWIAGSHRASLGLKASFIDQRASFVGAECRALRLLQSGST
jgi:hypothetical protein